MIALLNHQKLNFKELQDRGTPCLGLLSFAQLEQFWKYLQIAPHIHGELQKGGISRHESYVSTDYIELNIPAGIDNAKKPIRVAVCLREDLLLFVSDQCPVLNSLWEEIRSGSLVPESLSRVLFLFFDRLTVDDYLTLEQLEQHTAALEERVMTSRQADSCIPELVALRKALMMLKKFYQQLLNINESLEENANELIEPGQLRYFGMLTGRTQRLCQGILNLGEYVTQVREAYQAQVDIDLNKTMKFFTVITTIFSPLTLLVGWYGMNLRMPEYGWHYGYPFVLLLSAGYVAASIYLFKRRHWL